MRCLARALLVALAAGCMASSADAYARLGNFTVILGWESNPTAQQCKSASSCTFVVKSADPRMPSFQLLMASIAMETDDVETRLYTGPTDYTLTELREEERTLHMRGTAVGYAGSKAALSLFPNGQVSGLVKGVAGESIWIQNEEESGQLVMYYMSDVEADGSDTCGVVVDDVEGTGRKLLEHPLFHVHSQEGAEHDHDHQIEELPDDEEGLGHGGRTLQQLSCYLIRIAVDIDSTYLAAYSTEALAKGKVESILNAVSMDIYEDQLNSQLVISAWVVRNAATDPYNAASVVDDMLVIMTNNWNANQGSIQRDLATVFSARSFSTSVIGQAWLDGLCSTTLGYSYVKDYSSSDAVKVQLSAHEFGHNYGINHCVCSQNIMHASINNQGSTVFTQGSIDQAFDRMTSFACTSGSKALTPCTGLPPFPPSPPMPPPMPPVVACDGFCGTASGTGCWCDLACTFYGDCCPSYTPLCVDPPVPSPSPPPPPPPSPSPPPPPPPSPSPPPPSPPPPPPPSPSPPPPSPPPPPPSPSPPPPSPPPPPPPSPSPPPPSPPPPPPPPSPPPPPPPSPSPPPPSPPPPPPPPSPSPPPPPPPSQTPLPPLPQLASSCCGTGALGWEFRDLNDNPDVCGTSQGCQSGTWLEAHDYCDSLGGRLCMQDELDAAKGTGCSFNKQEVWTQSPCADGFLTRTGVCESISAVRPIRCCANACKTIPQTASACCDDLAWPFQSSASPTVCGESPGCVQLPWEAAYDHCAALGARLCTEDDLLAAKNTGCNFNKEPTWTQTPCSEGGVTGFITRTSNKANIIACVDRSTTRAVRCCADACV